MPSRVVKTINTLVTPQQQDNMSHDHTLVTGRGVLSSQFHPLVLRSGGALRFFRVPGEARQL
ncbi:MAG TPA: hypothetical protein VLQ80_26145, partial [Candidatus Saccharimonadia bacterium]|nr:hypothetical protein [Candidatus Saccharimonadia bacterium]